jgi:hypothetical protein
MVRIKKRLATREGRKLKRIRKSPETSTAANQVTLGRKRVEEGSGDKVSVFQVLVTR